ncbi:uncharacterized protein LOC21412065 isoform X1 [Morus notabilis]|uniref:uncharacterized protein LOC21412065 isoform X1 n=1 Tax=Morus notabilis TaxID=981085 RepID=UPI000CECE809|nr:uncharacterized protein LOC21412065 isoform X1 [Morus notabilis]
MTVIISTNVVYEVLNKYNYENWSGVVKTYLIAHDLWDVIEPAVEAAQKPQIKDHNTIEDETSEFEISAERKILKSEGYNLKEDKIKNARALHAIQISCGPDALSAIKGIFSAKDAWRILDETFKPDFFIKFTDSSDSSEEESFDGLDDKDKDGGKEFKRALEEQDWDKVKKMYTKNPGLLKGRFSSKKFSALHYAAQHSGSAGIVKDMVEKMSKEDMEIKDACGGGTALMMAIMAGSVEMVKCMMEKNPELITVEDNSLFLPVEVSLSCDDIDMICHLYYATKAYLSSRDHTDRRKHGATFISKCIKKKNLGTLGFALDLLKEDESLALTKDNTWESPLYVLACSPSLFGDGDDLAIFKRWIYKFISTKPAAPAAEIGGEQVEDPESGSDSTNMTKSGLDSFSSLVTKLLGIEQIREEKLVHERSLELLFEMCKAVNIKLAAAVDRKDLKDGLVLEALFAAVERGNTKFVSKLISKVPALWMSTDEYSRDIYMHAIEWRQAKLFTHMLRHISGNLISATSCMKDKFGNNLLHVAATLCPSTKLDRVPGAALQMQREIQWFKEVQKIVYPAALEEENSLDSLTPREVFTKNHKDLMKKGERWTKETTTFSSVVSALIVTMTFAAVFTVPDLEENTNRKLRTVFIISDGISLFSSASSLFVFLGLFLSTRYEEHDFLINLPLKLMVGISSLFISIITMLIAFCAILLLLLPESWVPIILLAALTVTLFAAMPFSLLIIIFKSTFCKRLSLTLKST